MQTFRKLPMISAEQRDDERSERAAASRSCGRRSRAARSGSGNSGERDRQLTRASPASSSYGAPAGSSGMPRQQRRRGRASPSRSAARRGTPANASTTGCSARSESSASSCSSRRSASLRSQSIVGRLRESLPHQRATTAGRRPAPASWPPATAATTGAPGSSRALLNQSRPPR